MTGDRRPATVDRRPWISMTGDRGLHVPARRGLRPPSRRAPPGAAFGLAGLRPAQAHFVRRAQPCGQFAKRFAQPGAAIPVV